MVRSPRWQARPHVSKLTRPTTIIEVLPSVVADEPVITTPSRWHSADRRAPSCFSSPSYPARRSHFRERVLRLVRRYLLADTDDHPFVGKALPQNRFDGLSVEPVNLISYLIGIPRVIATAVLVRPLMFSTLTGES